MNHFQLRLIKRDGLMMFPKNLVNTRCRRSLRQSVIMPIVWRLGRGGNACGESQRYQQEAVHLGIPCV